MKIKNVTTSKLEKITNFTKSEDLQFKQMGHFLLIVYKLIINKLELRHLLSMSQCPLLHPKDHLTTSLSG